MLRLSFFRICPQYCGAKERHERPDVPLDLSLIQAAVGVRAFSEDIAVAVIFRESTVALTVFIIAIETRTVGRDFNGTTVLAAHLEHAFVFFAIGAAPNAFSVHEVVFPVALIFVAVLPFVTAEAIALVVFPASGVDGHIFPDERTLSALLSLQERAFVDIAVGKGEHALARSLSIFVVALVDVAVSELIDATAFLHIVFQSPL